MLYEPNQRIGPNMTWRASPECTRHCHIETFQGRARTLNLKSLEWRRFNLLRVTSELRSGVYSRTPLSIVPLTVRL